MVLSMDIDYEISVIGFLPIRLNGVQRTELKDIFVNPDNNGTLITEEQFQIKPNSQIPFKVSYITSIQSFDKLVKEQLKASGHNEVFDGSTVIIKKITYNLEIKFLNPQKNQSETAKAIFVKEKLKLGFLLSP